VLRKYVRHQALRKGAKDSMAGLMHSPVPSHVLGPMTCGLELPLSMRAALG